MSSSWRSGNRFFVVQPTGHPFLFLTPVVINSVMTGCPADCQRRLYILWYRDGGDPGIQRSRRQPQPNSHQFLCFWCFQVPLAWYFLQKGWFGVHGVFAAIPVAETLIAVISLILFRRGQMEGNRRLGVK